MLKWEWCCRRNLTNATLPLNYDVNYAYIYRRYLSNGVETGRMRNPAVRVLFLIFIGEHGFKGPAMQVEIKHISGCESVWRDGGEELFIDRSVAQGADGRGRVRNLTYSQEYADRRSCGRERNIRAVVQRTTGP